MDSQMPQNNAEYGGVEYWDDRYESEESYDWLASVKFTDLIMQYLKTTHRILILGCGNSKMSEELYNKGYVHITNIDYSQVCTNKMVAKHEHCPHMTWEFMDMRNLDYANEMFDVVLEKATLDVLMVEEKHPHNLSQECLDNMDKVLSEVSRVLSPEGIFISFTFAQPYFRKPLYARSKFNWSVNHRTFGETFHYFLYIMQKGQSLSPEDLAKEKLRTSLPQENDKLQRNFGDVNEVPEDENYLLNIDL
ncbi:EEF1A lysine methyltransferase 4-like [Amphiura filiformis]|uniref:EEF1A lysine methyltransferase 4-like n=1 Tax=Amphiura filiformis TaxID=82378 RepID=UPI003B22443F